MPLESISELENKVNALVESYNELKIKNEELRRDIEGSAEKIQKLELENNELQMVIDAEKNNASGSRETLAVAAEKIKNLIIKLESVE